ncbi:MAG: hypothetical protein JEY71_08275 [Sphaerochaeta sp.]|nr:hypothetical protein [Sphaerochaeta sp.]
MENVIELQQLYNTYGSEHFSFSVLEGLPYDKDDETKDYKEDLAILTALYLEKIAEARSGVIQGDAMTVEVCTNNELVDTDIRLLADAVGKGGELLGERFSVLSSLLTDMG